MNNGQPLRRGFAATPPLAQGRLWPGSDFNNALSASARRFPPGQYTTAPAKAQGGGRGSRTSWRSLEPRHRKSTVQNCIVLFVVMGRDSRKGGCVSAIPRFGLASAGVHFSCISRVSPVIPSACGLDGIYHLKAISSYSPKIGTPARSVTPGISFAACVTHTALGDALSTSEVPDLGYVYYIAFIPSCKGFSYSLYSFSMLYLQLTSTK